MNRIAPDMAFRPEPLFRPLSATVGAEVPGLDLRDPLEPAAVEALKDGLAQHGVLLFRDQQLDVDAQVRFARYFGDLSGGYIGQTSEKRFGGQTGPTTGKQVMYVGNLTVDGEQGVIPTGELMFHADGLYTETPALGTMLFAIELPASGGGNTLFLSTGDAYDRLSPELRERVLDYHILLNFDYRSTVRPEQLAADSPGFVHPLVVRHPRSGRALLNCNRLMADHIPELPRAESSALIDELCTHVELGAEVYEHVWRVGDLLFWDNLATLHSRTDFDPNERRWMRRTAIKGSRPLPYRAGNGH
jgi:taurine dioxygenase